MQQLFVDVTEAAAALKLSRAQMYVEMSEGRLAFVKIGRLRRIPVGAIEAYAARLISESTES